MVAELTTTPVPRKVGDLPEDMIFDPQLLADWMYIVSVEMEKIAANSTTNTGDMKIIGADDVPSDWLICDGSTQNTASYISLQRFLFPGVVADTFTLPNMQAFILDNTTEEFFTLDSPVKSPFTVIIKA